MIQQKEFDRVSVPTFVHIQSATNHSWPTNVLCNAEQISGTPLSGLNTELRDPNTYVGLGGHLEHIQRKWRWSPGQVQRTLGCGTGMRTAAGFVAACLGAALGLFG